jgi:hypothetical protein
MSIGELCCPYLLVSWLSVSCLLNLSKNTEEKITVTLVFSRLVSYDSVKTYRKCGLDPLLSRTAPSDILVAVPGRNPQLSVGLEASVFQSKFSKDCVIVLPVPFPASYRLLRPSGSCLTLFVFPPLLYFLQ